MGLIAVLVCKYLTGKQSVLGGNHSLDTRKILLLVEHCIYTGFGVPFS
jgi:hypothetical protein